MTHAQGTGSCLSQSGPLLTIGGDQGSTYDNTSLSTNQKLDARTATWDGNGTWEVPVQIGGGASGICWSGGTIHGGYPLDASWDTTHPTAAMRVGARNFVVENVHATAIGDGIKIEQGSDNFTLRGAFLEDMRDDCVEGDFLPGGLIEDSLFNGCYVPFAFRPRNSDPSSDGRNKTVVIRNTLAWLRDQIGVYRGPVPGHSMFFKWPTGNDGGSRDRGLMISMHDTILRVDSTASEATSEQFQIPTDSAGNTKLVSCSNNTLVWGGSGAVPAELRAWPSCFTITSDMSVWNNAVAAWKQRHGYGGSPDPDPTPPPSVTGLRRTDQR